MSLNEGLDDDCHLYLDYNYHLIDCQFSERAKILVNGKECIQKSMALLVCTEESVERIAETAGYGMGVALSKAFKRIAEVSPQRYRLQATG